MDKEQDAIEVEVVSIDGLAPVHPQHEEEPAEESRQSWQDWQNWQGRVRQLDMRWWPLWVFLGIIFLILLFTVGIVLGVLYLVWRVIRGIVAAVFNRHPQD